MNVALPRSKYGKTFDENFESIFGGAVKIHKKKEGKLAGDKEPACNVLGKSLELADNWNDVTCNLCQKIRMAE